VTVQEEERRARERLRNLAKARTARRRQQADAARAEARRRRERIRELRDDERDLSRRYRAAMATVHRLERRTQWTPEEAAAWDDVHGIGDRMRSIIATRRRLEAEG
jgi:hypothetical protein